MEARNQLGRLQVAESEAEARRRELDLQRAELERQKAKKVDTWILDLITTDECSFLRSLSSASTSALKGNAERWKGEGCCARRNSEESSLPSRRNGRSNIGTSDLIRSQQSLEATNPLIFFF